MQYMLLIYSSTDAPPIGSPEQAEEHAAYFAFTQEVLAAGVMQSGAPLQEVDTATTVRVRGGERLVTDGPYAETKEALLGYYLIDCEDLDAAIGWAAKIPTALHGSIEVRPVLMIPGM
jgi:hypothetical protein